METEECFCCERQVKITEKTWYVHITINHEVVDADYEGADSQGCFPIGNTCRKKEPKAFRF